MPYHSSATIATNGQTVSGGTAQASNNMTVTFDVGYEITKNISASVTTGIPPKPHITGEGAVANLGMLGKVRYGPAFFTGYYRFPKIGPIPTLRRRRSSVRHHLQGIRRQRKEPLPR